MQAIIRVLEFPPRESFKILVYGIFRENNIISMHICIYQSLHLICLAYLVIFESLYGM